MGTEARIDAPRARDVAEQATRSAEAERPLHAEHAERSQRLLADLLKAARRSTEKQVGGFAANPFGLAGVGVVGQDAEGALVIEVQVGTADFPEEVAEAVDTIRSFLDEQLNAERDRMRRVLA